MANWSDGSIGLSGTKENIKLAIADIEANKDENFLCPLQKMLRETPDMELTVAIKSGFGGGEILVEEYFETEINMELNGRWCSPYSYFIELASKFNLSGTYSDSEAGCNFFHRIEFTNGEVVSDEEYNYVSRESIEARGTAIIDEYAYIADEENWEEDYSDIIDNFESAGIKLEDLKEYWCVEA